MTRHDYRREMTGLDAMIADIKREANPRDREFKIWRARNRIRKIMLAVRTEGVEGVAA